MTARSIARGLPAPLAGHGGYRVDTGSADEHRRWVFPALCAGLTEIAHRVTEPRHAVRLVATSEALRAVLPPHWVMGDHSHFMTTEFALSDVRVPAGYMLSMNHTGAVTQVTIVADDGALAASGYAARTDEAFVYDRIVTAADHRRRGLGGVVMAALGRTKCDSMVPSLLVATDAGRRLYETLGWRTLAPCASAAIPPT